jgi:hypothetical protein
MLAAKSSDLSFRAKRSVVEEWSERDERHGRVCREGSGERVGRRTSSISCCSPLSCSTLRDVSTPLDMTKDDIAQGRKFQPSFPIASVGQTSMALCSVGFLGRSRTVAEFVRHSFSINATANRQSRSRFVSHVAVLAFGTKRRRPQVGAILS